MAFFRCGFSENSLEPLKHVRIPVGGFNVEANGTPESYPNNIKNVFPRDYKDMVASDFEMSSSLGSSVYAGVNTSSGYTRSIVSNVKYDKVTGTLTASVSISHGGSGLSQIYQGATATWKGTINGIKV